MRRTMLAAVAALTLTAAPARADTSTWFFQGCITGTSSCAFAMISLTPYSVAPAPGLPNAYGSAQFYAAGNIFDPAVQRITFFGLPGTSFLGETVDCAAACLYTRNITGTWDGSVGGDPGFAPTFKYELVAEPGVEYSFSPALIRQTTVPEPATLALLGTGLLGLGGMAVRRRQGRGA